jgi:L-methionine (R)-S-oxide reductase
MEKSFKLLLDEIDVLATSGKDRDSILLNICQLLKEKVYHYDWVGFYIADQQSVNLVLGPYAGKSTDHTIIPFGKGVCGQVAETKQTKIVQDVSKEANYLSCSIDVQSEIVSPVLKDGQFVAELDIDSHSTAPFTKNDEEFLESLCRKIATLF